MNEMVSGKSIFSQFDEGNRDDNCFDFGSLDFEELTLKHDIDDEILWCHFDQKDRPCFTFNLGDEIQSLQFTLEQQLPKTETVKYFIFGSNTPGVFNLGGDLELFVNKIRDNDIVGMKKYAKQSVEILNRNIQSFQSDVITIGLIQGNALGGGFEFAMSFDILIAEKSVRFGLPEILFNLFPGMGAYSFLLRKIGRRETEKMILSGATYSAEQLYDLGVVDVLAEDGQGEAVAVEYARNNRKRFHAEKSIYDARKLTAPITLDELLTITYDWAETAMKLSLNDLNKMERLVNAQKRLSRKRRVPA